MRLWGGLLSCLVTLSACAEVQPAPLVAANEAARSLRDSCGPPFVEDPAIVAADAIMNVGGLYGRAFAPVSAGGGILTELAGLRLTFDVRPEWTSFEIMRTLRCHQARLLVQGPPFPTDDPYLLPDRWLAIDVESGNDGVAVLLVPPRPGEVREIERRLRAFLGDRSLPRPPRQ